LTELKGCEPLGVAEQWSLRDPENSVTDTNGTITVAAMSMIVGRPVNPVNANLVT